MLTTHPTGFKLSDVLIDWLQLRLEMPDINPWLGGEDKIHFFKGICVKTCASLSDGIYTQDVSPTSRALTSMPEARPPNLFNYVPSDNNTNYASGIMCPR